MIEDKRHVMIEESLGVRTWALPTPPRCALGPSTLSSCGKRTGAPRPHAETRKSDSHVALNPAVQCTIRLPCVASVGAFDSMHACIRCTPCSGQRRPRTGAVPVPSAAVCLSLGWQRCSGGGCGLLALRHAWRDSLRPAQCIPCGPCSWLLESAPDRRRSPLIGIDSTQHSAGRARHPVDPYQALVRSLERHVAAVNPTATEN
jgi:hypothetical protein